MSKMHGVPVTVIIPAKDEERSIGPLLDSLVAQSTPPAEVVVVDAGSTDRTIEIVNRYAGRDVPVRILAAPGAYPGVARNAGARAASTEWLAFLDAGVSISTTWIETMWAARSRVPSCNVVYSNWMPLQDSFFRRAFALTFHLPRILVDGKRCTIRRGGYLALTKSAWEEAGGYPPFRASEDRQFLTALEKLRDVHAEYAVDALVLWHGPSTLKEDFLKLYNFGYHDLLAGRFRDWHFPVMKINAIMVLMTAAAVVSGIPWWSVPGLITMARVSKRWIKQGRDIESPWYEVPLLLPFAGILLIASDVAALASGVKCVWNYKILRRPNPYSVSAH